jgi:hypothetical protein
VICACSLATEKVEDSEGSKSLAFGFLIHPHPTIFVSVMGPSNSPACVPFEARRVPFCLNTRNACKQEATVQPCSLDWDELERKGDTLVGAIMCGQSP